MGNLGSQELLLLILLFIIMPFMGKRIIDWFFEVKKRNRYMEAQIQLLMHIAAKQGVDADKISEIVAAAQLPPRKTNA